MDKIALHFFSPPNDAFWRWQEGGEVVEWVDGRTISFRAELLPVLRSLAPYGLPSLGCLLLVLAASRDSWRDSSTEYGILTGILVNGPQRDEAIRVLAEVITKLDQLNSLDSALRSSLEAKLALCEMIFADKFTLISIEDAPRIVKQLELGLGEELSLRQANPMPERVGAKELLNELKALDQLLEHIDEDELRLRAQTGFSQLPQPAELELPMAQAVRSLLSDLRDDDELRGIAQLSLNLMAAVTLPRAIADSEEAQMGGVSDISNRGPLDRLLLSELAHDDLTLSVRIALNEAMYLRREAPPRNPPQQRAVLLDASLRGWGVPRAFATAVGLAVAATTENHVELFFRRAKQAKAVPVDLTTRDGLLDHLAALEPELHPGESLPAFNAELLTAENPSEPLLIVAEDVLEDPQFRATLDESELSAVYIATVNRSGRFRLLERNFRGSKVLREAMLDLDCLFKDTGKRSKDLIDPDLARELPAIFRAQPFPLRLCHQFDPKRIACVQGRGVLTMPNDGRLMFWNKPVQGAIQISPKIPIGALWWCSRNPLADKVCAIVGHLAPKGLHLLQVDLEERSCESIPLELNRGARGIIDHAGMIFAIFPSSIQAIDPETGEVAQTLELPAGLIWERGRFFRTPRTGSWYALAYDGRGARLELLLNESNLRCPPLTSVFERDEVDGPIGFTNDRNVYLTAQDKLQQVHYDIPSAPNVWDVSPDGSKVAVWFPGHPPGVRKPVRVLNVQNLDATKYFHPLYWNIDHDLLRMMSASNIRHRFVYACVDAKESFALCTRKQHLMAIEYNPSSNQIFLQTRRPENLHARRNFSPIELKTDYGFNLTGVSWEDGSTAYLDSRGLLHLKSSDSSLPECTIVLTDGPLAGWCSDGRSWGQHYFIEKENAPVREIYNTVIQPFVERLR